MKVICLVALLAGVVYSVKKEWVELSHLEWDTGRYRRSLTRHDDACSLTLTLNFTLHGENVVLNLAKNDLHEADPAVYISEERGIRKLPQPPKQTFCLYKGINKGSSMLVKCKNGTCNMCGTFSVKNVTYKLTSSEEASKAEVEKVNIHDKTFHSDYILPPKEAANENKPTGSRRKRAIPNGAHIVEYVAFPDESVYQYFLGIHNTEQDTVTAINEYYALIVNTMDQIYQSVPASEPTVHIRVYLSAVVIAKTAGGAPWSTNSKVVVDGETHLNVYAALSAFDQWHLTNLASFISHDYGMAYSRKELSTFYLNGTHDSDAVAGLAYLGVVCKSVSNVGITEDDGQRVGFVSAHELGHGLNSNHDGTGDQASCSSTNRNVMSGTYSRTVSNTVLAGNQWLFSACSALAFKNHISIMPNDCMMSHSFTTAEYDTLRNKQLPGQIYSLNQQCQLMIGPDALSCTTHHFQRVADTACYGGMSCRDSSASATCYGYPVLSGTPCGDEAENKWCYLGICVARPATEATTTTTSTTTTTPTTTLTTPTTTPTTPTTTPTTPTITPTTPTTTPITQTTTPTTPTTPPTTPTTTPTTPTTTPTTPTTTPTTPTTTPTTPTTTPTTPTTTPTTPTTRPTTPTTTPTTPTTTPTTPTTTPITSPTSATDVTTTVNSETTTTPPCVHEWCCRHSRHRGLRCCRGHVCCYLYYRKWHCYLKA